MLEEEINTTTPPISQENADENTADKLAQGLTLVPYRAYNERGELTWFSKWVRLERGESISQASKRLSVPPKEPAWTPELKARVDELMSELFGGAEPR